MFGANAEVNRTRMSGVVQVGIRYVLTLISRCQRMRPTEIRIAKPTQSSGLPCKPSRPQSLVEQKSRCCIEYYQTIDPK